MKHMTGRVIGVLAASLAASAAQAQTETANLDEVIVTGTRAAGRLVTDSPAPVDVISSETIAARGAQELSRVLQMVAPSFNFPRTATGPSSTGIRAATLRGLSPDQVLVLVNGKRWHGSSVINFNNVIGRGSVPIDLNAIPVGAIGKVEILRDGAAAQYGSDAIAGVINIQLKTASEGGEVSVQAGQTSEGDGQNVAMTYNQGLKLGQGFANITAEIRSRNSTSRAAVDSRFGRVTNEHGDPDALDAMFTINAAHPVGEAEVYGDLNYNRRKSISPGQYRAPTIAPSLYPNGFVPHIRVDLDDLGGSLGVRGKRGAWAWDLSNTIGYNKAEFENNSVNTSLIGSTQKIFDAGATRYFQDLVNLTVSRPFQVLSGANLALGLEGRYEAYKIRSGEPNSFFGAGAQAFPGFNPPTPVDESRRAFSAFADGELSLTSQINLGAALRYEHYSDFGDATVGKISAFYRPSPIIAFRATAATGFRAPSLQQTFFSTISSQQSGGVLVNVGTFAVDDPISRALGSRSLKPEKTQSLSAGIVLTPAPGLVISADLFRIDIDDRIVLSETLLGPAVTNVLRAAGVTNTSQVRFFNNAVDTRTEGYEITADWRTYFGEAKFNATAAYMLVDTDITTLRANPVIPALPLLAPISIDLLTKAQPQNKLTLGGRLEWRQWTASVDVTRYGPFRYIAVAAEQTYDPRTVVDAIVDFAATDSIRLGAGVLNITNQHPARVADRARTQGGSLQYPEVGALGMNGREYYVKVSKRF